MDNQLTPTEIQEVQQILKDYNPAQEAFTILEKNQGRLDASFDELWEANILNLLLTLNFLLAKNKRGIRGIG